MTCLATSQRSACKTAMLLAKTNLTATQPTAPGWDTTGAAGSVALLLTSATKTSGGTGSVSIFLKAAQVPGRCKMRLVVLLQEESGTRVNTRMNGETSLAAWVRLGSGAKLGAVPPIAKSMWMCGGCVTAARRAAMRKKRDAGPASPSRKSAADKYTCRKTKRLA